LLGVGVVVVVVVVRVLGQVVLWLLLVPAGGLGIWGAQVQGHGVGPLGELLWGLGGKKMQIAEEESRFIYSP